MKKNSPASRKRRTREHVIADLSVNFVERQVLQCGHTLERVFHDYGIDLVMHSYNDKGEIEPELAARIGDRLFGCDECVLACPYQAKAPSCKNKQFKFYNDRAKLNLNEILTMTEEHFEVVFADSVFARLSLECLKRNAHICLNNKPH